MAKTETEIIVDGILALARKVEQGPSDNTDAILTVLKERLLDLDISNIPKYERTQDGLDDLAMAIFPYATSILMGRAKAAVGLADDVELSKEQLMRMEDMFLDMVFANSSAGGLVESRWDALNAAQQSKMNPRDEYRIQWRMASERIGDAVRDLAGAKSDLRELESKRAKELASDDAPVTELELGARARECLRQLGIKTIGQLISTPETTLLDVDGFGPSSLHGIQIEVSIWRRRKLAWEVANT